MLSNYVRGPADPYTPEPYVLRFLHNFDPALRLRWSQRFSHWKLERKTAHAMSYLSTLSRYRRAPNGDMVENDSWIQARDGYTAVTAFPSLPMLGDWTVRMLQWGDPWRFRKDELSDLIAEQEARAAVAKKRVFDNHVEAVAKEQYQEMVWDGGERAAVPSNYKEENNGY